MSTLGIAICMGIYYWIARLRFGYTISSALLQPATIGVFVGLITGQMVTAMEIGAALQLVYLGVTSTPGGNVPNDPALAGCIATLGRHVRHVPRARRGPGRALRSHRRVR